MLRELVQPERRERRLHGFDRRLLMLSGAAVTLGAALILVTNAWAGSPVQIVSATVNADRSLSVSWNIPAGTFGGVLVVSSTSTTDFTGEMPFDVATTIDYDLLASGWTTYRTLPLHMTVQEPTTVYAQVQLVDPYLDGRCQQGHFLVDCDSQVVALPINPICSPVIVTAGYYTKELVKAAYYAKQRVHGGHWLRRHGHYVRRHGHRVWVKAVYRRIYHPPVYHKVWHPPVYQTQCR